MKCPFCGNDRTSVVDSRVSKGGQEIRRRRHCTVEEGGCNERFTTFERLEARVAVVVKKDQRRVPYDRDKVKSGIRRATWKTMVAEEEIDEFLTQIENKFSDRQMKEVTTQAIGQEVLRFLKSRDEVAYIRFMSVYAEFRTAAQFRDLLSNMEEGGV